MKELKRYFSYIGKYKTAYWTVFVFTLVSSAVLTFAYPYMNKLIFNALEYRDIQIFWCALALCIVLVILNCLAPYRRYFQIKIVRKIVFDIKIRLFEKLLKLDMEYYEKNHSGDALKTLNWDANSLKDSYFLIYGSKEPKIPRILLKKYSGMRPEADNETLPAILFSIIEQSPYYSLVSYMDTIEESCGGYNHFTIGKS